MFPTSAQENVGILVTGVGAAMDFTVLATGEIPDLSGFGAQTNGQFFARYVYEAESSEALFAAADGSAYTRVDNISNAVLADYQTAFGNWLTKDDVFYYVYGLLHSPDYREAFAADLKKMLPRIPRVSSAEDFRAFATAGRDLVTLHVGYESVDPYAALTVSGDRLVGSGSADPYEWFRVEKMRFGGKGKAKDRSTIIYNARITISGIPEEAYEYMLGSRSAIEWMFERYQVKTDKASGIVNDPNDWSRGVEDPRYILDLLCRIVTVSIETVHIVRGLPKLELP
jgi:predicted helicase